MDVSVREFIGAELDDLERELLGGVPLAEAEPDILARFDASCAAADREAARAATP